MWSETFPGVLALRYHVNIYDNRGMGHGSDNNVTPTISGYSGDAATLMHGLGSSSMHVYGVSMESSISQQMVIVHPDRVRKLILESVIYSIRLPETRLLYLLIQSTVIPLFSGLRRMDEFIEKRS